MELARDAAALLPCAVGISCWRGTPGDPKGATTGCWNIIPWRPTSIRDLLAWSGMQNTQFPQHAKKYDSSERKGKIKIVKKKNCKHWVHGKWRSHTSSRTFGSYGSPFCGIQASNTQSWEKMPEYWLSRSKFKEEKGNERQKQGKKIEKKRKKEKTKTKK